MHNLTVYILPGSVLSDAPSFQTYLTEAMQGGYVICNIAVLMLIGVAGAGKTSFLQLVLDLPPLAKRKSTPLAMCAIRAVSVSRAAVSEKGMVWTKVTRNVLLEMLSSKDAFQLVKGDPAMASQMQQASTVGLHESVQQNSSSGLAEGASQTTVKQPSLDQDSLLTASRPSYVKLGRAKPVQELIAHEIQLE